MIKMIFCIRKLSDMKDEDFHRYWLEHHGTLIQERAELIKLKKYIQSHIVPDTEGAPLNKALQDTRGTTDPYDGTAELWWDSEEDLVAAAQSSEGAKAFQDLLEDEKKFIDLKRSCILFAEEKVIVG